MPSLTVENYVKAIALIAAREPADAAVATGALAQALRVSPGTVTGMLKTLSEANLATYTPYEGARLTPAGQRLAMKVIRRHRLLEQFLVATLKMPWDEVHEEAEHMEHAVSDRLIDRIDAFLGHPAVDPHGDPIPRADGSLAEPEAAPLSRAARAATTSRSSGSSTKTPPSSATSRNAASTCTPRANSSKTGPRPARSSSGSASRASPSAARPPAKCWSARRDAGRDEPQPPFAHSSPLVPTLPRGNAVRDAPRRLRSAPRAGFVP